MATDEELRAAKLAQEIVVKEAIRMHEESKKTPAPTAAPATKPASTVAHTAADKVVVKDEKAAESRNK